MEKQLHVVVCMKMTPDSSDLTIDPVKKTLDRSKVKNIINPPDENAFEEALALKDAHGAKVTVVTMGPPFFDVMLRECISRGADHGVLITDRAFAGADTYPTGLTLAAGIKKISRDFGDVDLIFFGEETTDASTGQVGPGVAAHLETEQATYVHKNIKYDPATKKIEVFRSIGGGDETLRLPLPACVTFELGVNTPRLASLNGKLRGIRQALEIWSLATLSDIKNPDWVGLKGSPTIVGKVDISSGDERECNIVADGAVAVEHLLTNKLAVFE